MKKNLIYYTAALALVLCLGACEEERSLSDLKVDDPVSMIIGYQRILTVNPVPAGAAIDQREVVWSSADELIATVTPKFGVVTAVEEGSTTITATYNGITQTIPITVTDPVVLPARKVWWLFDDASNLFKAENGGTDLEIGTGRGAVFGGTAGFSAAAGPSAGNGAIHVDRGYFLKAEHGIAPNGGGTRVNEFTIMFELKCAPEDKDNNYKSLLRAKNETNLNDADWFMRKDYIGGGSLPGSPGGSVQPEVWNRLVVSTKSGQFCYVYLNGTLISETPSGYRSIDDERSSLLSTFLFFADEDGEDAAWDVAEITMWGQALDKDQLAKLSRYINKGLSIP